MVDHGANPEHGRPWCKSRSWLTTVQIQSMAGHSVNPEHGRPQWSQPGTANTSCALRFTAKLCPAVTGRSGLNTNSTSSRVAPIFWKLNVCLFVWVFVFFQHHSPQHYSDIIFNMMTKVTLRRKKTTDQFVSRSADLGSQKFKTASSQHSPCKRGK